MHLRERITTAITNVGSDMLVLCEIVSNTVLMSADYKNRALFDTPNNVGMLLQSPWLTLDLIRKVLLSHGIQELLIELLRQLRSHGSVEVHPVPFERVIQSDLT